MPGHPVCRETCRRPSRPGSRWRRRRRSGGKCGTDTALPAPRCQARPPQNPPCNLASYISKLSFLSKPHCITPGTQTLSKSLANSISNVVWRKLCNLLISPATNKLHLPCTCTAGLKRAIQLPRRWRASRAGASSGAGSSAAATAPSSAQGRPSACISATWRPNASMRRRRSAGVLAASLHPASSHLPPAARHIHDGHGTLVIKLILACPFITSYQRSDICCVYHGGYAYLQVLQTHAFTAYEVLGRFARLPALTAESTTPWRNAVLLVEFHMAAPHASRTASSCRAPGSCSQTLPSLIATGPGCTDMTSDAQEPSVVSCLCLCANRIAQGIQALQAHMASASRKPSLGQA